jgi:hypothetical protein
MKVAVLLVGQPRNAIQCSENILKNIILPNNADVFIHTWYDKDNLYMEKGEKDRGNCICDSQLDVKLLEIYKPKAFCIEKQKFNNFNNYGCNYYECPDKYLANVSKDGKNKELTLEEVKLRILKYTHLSQLYSIFKCNLLKEEYSLENNILYDCVIKVRFDINITSPIICSHYSMDRIYFQYIGQPDNLISDWFNMGSNEIMNVLASIFLNIKYLNNYQGYYKSSERLPVSLWDTTKCNISPEFFIRDMMHKYKIPAQAINIGLGLSVNT